MYVGRSYLFSFRILGGQSFNGLQKSTCLNWQQSKRFVPGSLVGIKDIDFVGRSEAETP